MTRPSLLRRAFRRVHLFLNPGGVFIFDINTPEKLRGLDGGLFVDESEEDYCVWRTEYAPRRKICTFALDVFRREGEHWARGGEVTEEYAYTVAELKAYLEEAGFENIRVFGDRKQRAPRPGEERVFFVAGK
ncbi:hypothetical protein SDC9_142041 [bioreactor metagenome]|uniref:Methyltransferase type 11 domain-containing protein n=1 Tax=bioreactor metagenome TaxID=1076179 RepID=A0A645E2U2_9ZZZZ